MRNFLIGLFLILTLAFLAQPILGQGNSKNAPAQMKKDTTVTQKKNAVVGSVNNLNGDTVTVSDKNNKQTQAIIDTTTKIMDQNNKPIKIGAIKLKDKIALIASGSSETSTPGAKLKIAKVFVKNTSESGALKRHAVFGVINSIEGFLITLMHQIQRDRLFQVRINELTQIKIKGITDATLADLEVGQRIAAVGETSSDGAILAKRIHVVPGKATGVFKKQPLATPSARPTTASATPSAIPSVSPTVTPSASLPPSDL